MYAVDVFVDDGGFVVDGVGVGGARVNASEDNVDVGAFDPYVPSSASREARGGARTCF